MCPRINISPFIGTFFIVAVSIARSASAVPDDACALITQTQVSSAVGVAVGAGEHTTPTFVRTCTWTRLGHPDKGVKYVTLNLQSANGYDTGKNLMNEMRARMHSTEVSNGNLGDDSYYVTMQGKYTALMVKKGDIAFKVAVYGAVPSDQAKAMDKTLALQVLSKL